MVTASTPIPHREALSPRVKSLNYLSHIMAKSEGNLAGADEVLMLDSEGHAIGGAGALALPGAEPAAASTAAPLIAGQPCPSCGAHAYIKRDGCMFCTACGHQGECG